MHVFNVHILAFQFLTWRGWHFGLSIVPFTSWYTELKFYARTNLAINWHGVILLKTYPFWCPLFIGLAVALQPVCSWKLNNPKLVRNNCSSGVLMVPWLSSSLLPMDLQPQIKDCHCLWWPHIRYGLFWHKLVTSATFFILFIMRYSSFLKWLHWNRCGFMKLMLWWQL